MQNETALLLHALKKRRTDLGLTQKEAAERAGILQANYSRMESGKTLPTLEMFLSILRALDLELSLQPVKKSTTWHVMYLDEPVCDVTVSSDLRSIRYQKWKEDGILQPFSGTKLDLERFYRFLKSRCYEDDRGDLREILKKAHFQDNDPYAWVRLTHGVTYDDFFWVRTDDEACTWDEVKIR